MNPNDELHSERTRQMNKTFDRSAEDLGNSIGLEHLEDLKADFSQAFTRA